MKPWEMDAVLRALVRRGTRRGLLGGNPAWLVIGALAFVVRRLRRREAGVVWSEEVSPGQVVTVDHFPSDRPRRGRGRRDRSRTPSDRPEVPEAPVEWPGPTPAE